VNKTDKLVIVGDSAFAEVAYEYFTFDSPYEVVGFAVERAYHTQTEKFGLPVVPFEDLEAHFPPGSHSVFAALVYTQLNRLRARLSAAAKAKGYKLASYISPRAFVWRNVKIGEHCFIFENNVIQPFVEIGNNVVLWSGNHIGHHTKIGDHVFVASHVVVSGFCTIGEFSFLGVNATIANNVSIGADNWIGPNVVSLKSTGENEFFIPPKSELHRVTPRQYNKVPQ
jgi:sugar O-acyltransferase (sialic acid O-acetyltransferase NeuD family)